MRPGRFARGLGLIAAGAVVAVAADATVIEPNRITTTRLELSPGRLAAALGGESVVHLSDLHLRGIGTRERRLLDALRREDPALIVMTGDYADTSEGVGALGEFFSALRPRLGIVAVPGNNDYFRGRQEAIFAALRSAGVKVLANESVVIEGRGGPFAVAGVDDPFFGRDDEARALSMIPDGIPAILLAHSPAVLAERSEAMLFNAGDASGPWGLGWFWQNGSHFRSPLPAISFRSSGTHTIRLQRREDGVGVGAIRLVPAGSAAPAGDGPGRTPPDADAAPGAIDVDLCGVRSEEVGGSWRLDHSRGGACTLRDEPDEGRLASFALVDPPDRVDLHFQAPSGTAYEVWVQLYSPTSTGRSDSLYVQFDDAVDTDGAPRYRIGSAVPPAAGPRVDLVLAGHTHGGQVRIPWLGPVERSLTRGPFVMGRYEVGGTTVYVSRGIGTSYLPLRFDCAPEVVVIEPAAPAVAAENGRSRT